ncbi:MAG: FIVAR domain-containing protein, partial [Propionibacteriaceae bacterium]|nr:FIVAR domain-containing protein [Propionibacteriaceae bacterium]
MKKGISIIVALIMLVALVPQATAATKVSNSSTPGGIDGLDPNPYVGEHNSYAWCSELFHQNDGDYLWVGTNRDLAGNILALAADPSPGVFTVFGIPEPSGDMLGRIYRQRASDPDAPWELIYATPIVSGFRRMIVFNEDLYVVGATTNTPLADYSIVLRFAQGFKPGDKPEIVLWDTIRDDTREHFRAATLFHDKLMIGTFDSKIFTTNGVGLRDLTPNTGNNAPGWDLFIDFRDYGITDAIWDILEFNGSLYAFIAGEEMQDYQSAGDMQMRGFRVMKVTPSSSGLVVKEIVGDTGAPYPFGMGLNKNASASGFLSTSFDQDYVYVTTFASGPALAIGMLKGYYREAFEKLFSPAQVYRFGADDIWEVVVGDTTGANVAVDAAGNPVPYIGNQRGGFSLLPDDRKNTSFNQYTWWMAEYDSKLYVTTWDMSTFKDQWPVYSNKYIDTLIPGANKILNTSYVDLARLHMLLRRDAPNVNWEKLAQDLDDYMVSLEGLDRTNQVALRAAIVGAIPIINSSLPATSVDFRTANQLLVPIITNVVNGTEPSELGAREVVARIVEYFRFTSEYFADNTDPAGFDLFVSEDGVNFEPVTVNGLGDRSNYGGRIMVSSEHGLNLGTANPFNGAQVWRVDPVKLGIYPNGPSSIAMGRSTQSVMTVLVTDARSVLGDLSMSYDSDLVDVQLVKRSSRNVANLSWDNVTVYNASKRVWEYAPEEIVTNTVSDVYEVVLTPTGRGIEALTLNFSLGSATASRTINLSVDSPQVATKQALGERLAEVSRAQRSEYEPETWAPFITAYGEAMLVYNNNSSQSQIDTALENLNAAVSGLRYVQAPEGYTIIKTEDQLRSMTRTGNYWLGNDIQLTKPWTPIAQFDGVLDGNGRTISNLTIGNPTLSNQGFFRRTGGDATIRDVEFVVGNAGIRGYDRVGVVVGWADSSRFIGVRVR